MHMNIDEGTWESLSVQLRDYSKSIMDNNLSLAEITLTYNLSMSNRFHSAFEGSIDITICEVSIEHAWWSEEGIIYAIILRIL